MSIFYLNPLNPFQPIELFNLPPPQARFLLLPHDFFPPQTKPFAPGSIQRTQTNPIYADSLRTFCIDHHFTLLV